jgi:ribosomal protein L16 Arg81 hydroxylase
VIRFDLTLEEFRAEVFERKPHLMRGALIDRPIAWADIDQLLYTMPPGLPYMRLFRQGLVPDNAYVQEISDPGRTRRRINKAKFYELLANGGTIQINWLEQHMLAAKRLCLEVARFAAAPTSGNCYMSFSGAGSFGKHWDTHDVFVIQLIGRKRWQLFEPTFPLPLTYQTNDRSGQTPPTEPAVDLVLEEGDVIYVPRGWWHNVIPLDIGSFHLAVGVYPPMLFDYIVQTTAKFLEQQEGARHAFTATGYRDAVTELLQQLPNVLLDPANAARFEHEWASRERMDGELTLAALDTAAPPLSGDVKVALTTSRRPGLESGTVLVNGAQLGLDALSQSVVAALRDVAHLTFDELCTRVANAPPDNLRRAVLDLARHDILTIEHD